MPRSERYEPVLQRKHTDWYGRPSKAGCRSGDTVVVRLPKGVSLVRYGTCRSIVRILPDARDRQFIDTDAAMRGRES